ncbi:hypothetical protein K458DRAFT_188896 [Lentithecium fluviatile CBS 122367]|uniref:F-box domain-containing protein n=1 Tax=Lentithecium fluviatile CBS 122367 TaxID=1168545 RepID=A0A6G1JAP3_9PLEO|nr:hypothetical protein K458DRAFT_188896 [Lentithecium fluviatile CBS 122367]
MGTAMIQALQELKGIDSRIAALEALTRELSPYEWRVLGSLLNSRTFQFDIVGTVPVEIVALIFSYLDITTAFRLQAVSKRWCTLLRSPAVWKRGLNAWFDDNFGNDYGLYAHKAQKIHRFRTGKYAALVKLPTDGNPSGLLNRTALVEDRFVYLSSTERDLIVRDLRTRGSWQTHGDAREKIIAVAASDQLVAYATTLNVCHVSSLAGERKTQFKLPSGMFKALACRGCTVVCGGLFISAAEFYVWDFNMLRGKSFRIGYDQPPFVHRHR